MPLLNLLSLNDDGIDRVTMVVRAWCQLHQVSVNSQRGHDAMSAAVQLSLAGETSPEILSDKLSCHMRLEQYKSPTD
jgi:acetolactate synthase regulatory subunit